MTNTMRNWIEIAGVCLVFALGMVAGAALTMRIERAHAERLFVSGHLGDVLTERLTRRLTTKLNCDAQQSAEVHAILLDAQRDMQAARRQITPQLRQVFFQAAGRVRGVLRGDQVAAFDEIMANIRARENHAEAASAVPPAGPPTTLHAEAPDTVPPRR